MNGLNGRLLVLGLALANPLISQQNIGTSPQPGLDASDLYAAFRISLNDTSENPATQALTGLQVGMRARSLGLNGRSPLDAWTVAQSLLTRPVALPAKAAQPVLFTGTAAWALNAVLRSSPGGYIRVTASSLNVDQPIDLTQDGATLDLASTVLTSTQPYMVRITGAHNITLMGGIFTGGNSAVLVSQASGVVVENSRISDLTGNGIVVTASNHVMVTHNRISGLGGAGVVIHAGTTLSTAEQNDISGGVGQSNWAAGIMVSDRDADLAANPQALYGPSGYWPILAPVRDRTHPPRDNLIAFNHIAFNTSSGIYMDGGVRMTIFGNTVQGNAKEGMCLDNGATANVVSSNVFQQNGKRWGQTDTTLRLDFVEGRLPDGTAAAKLPGISIDNAAYNVVYANNISHNSGGGIKMVRTGFFNVLGQNVIENDNDGASIYYRFFGIELGFAAADAPSPELDFTPSRGNVIFSNLIRGTHGAGIFIQGGSDQNQISDNVIMDAKDWAIESATQTQNAAHDNLTDMPSLNIGAACCSFRATPRPIHALSR